MNSFSTFVGIISGLCGIVGLMIAILNSKKIGKFGITMIVVILIAVIGAGVFFSTSTTITTHPPSNPFAAHPTDTATATPISDVTTTPTPSPTPATIMPKSPQLPLPIPCSECKYLALQVRLDRISPDDTNQGTNWTLFIADKGTLACNQSSFNYATYIADPQGTANRADSNNQWSMLAGTSITESLHFPNFVPQSGVTYTLNIEIDSSCTPYGGFSGSNTYQTENITF